MIDWTRNPALEEELFARLRRKFIQDRTKEIHFSDTMYCLTKAYWEKTSPLPVDNHTLGQIFQCRRQNRRLPSQFLLCLLALRDIGVGCYLATIGHGLALDGNDLAIGPNAFLSMCLNSLFSLRPFGD